MLLNIKLLIAAFIIVIFGPPISFAFTPDFNFDFDSTSIKIDTLSKLLSDMKRISINNSIISDSIYFPDYSASNIFIANSTFYGSIDLTNCKVDSDLHIVNTDFYKPVRFTGTEFQKSRLYFINCRFHDSTFFNEMRMHGAVSINKCEFKKYVTFEGSTFSEYVDFDESVFEDESFFRSISILDEGSFYLTIFNQPVYFDGRELQLNKVSFDSTFFNNESYFSGGLIDCEFANTDLSKVIFYWVRLQNIIFEPNVNPITSNIALATNLDQLTFNENPVPLIRLYGELKRDGFYDQAMALNYAVKKRQNEISFREGNYLTFLFRLIFLELPCKYGYLYWRPLKWWFNSIWIFGFIYFLICRFGSLKNSIQYTLIPAAYDKSECEYKSVLLSETLFSYEPKVKYLKYIFRNLRILLESLYFSILNATNVGLREYQVSRLVKYLRTKNLEYLPLGVIRPISAIQTAISAYLIFLWLIFFVKGIFE